MALRSDEIKKLTDVFEACGWDEMRLEIGDQRLVLRRQGGTVVDTLAAAPQPLSLERPAALSASGGPDRARVAERPSAAVAGESNALFIRAPNLGTFWRKPKPGAPPYVEVGGIVNAETTVCLIEVMKLFTPMRANLEGRIAEILAKDGDMVEYAAPLFRVEPVD